MPSHVTGPTGGLLLPAAGDSPAGTPEPSQAMAAASEARAGTSAPLQTLTVARHGEVLPEAVHPATPENSPTKEPQTTSSAPAPKPDLGGEHFLSPPCPKAILLPFSPFSFTRITLSESRGQGRAWHAQGTPWEQGLCSVLPARRGDEMAAAHQLCPAHTWELLATFCGTLFTRGDQHPSVPLPAIC